MYAPMFKDIKLDNINILLLPLMAVFRPLTYLASAFLWLEKTFECFIDKSVVSVVVVEVHAESC